MACLTSWIDKGGVGDEHVSYYFWLCCDHSPNKPTFDMFDVINCEEDLSLSDAAETIDRIAINALGPKR